MKKITSNQANFESSRRRFLTIGGLSVALLGSLSHLWPSGKKGESNSLGKKLSNLTTDVKPLTHEDYLMRIEQVKRLLHEFNMDGLLLTGGTNLQYFVNVSWWRSERFFGVIINKKVDPIWICPAFELKRAKESIKFGRDIRTWEEHENPYELVKGVMQDLNALRGKLAMGPTVRSFFIHGIKKYAPTIQLVDGSPITERCRGIKTEKELGFMDLANRITKLAYQESFKRLHEGMEPRQLANSTRAAHSQMGVSGGGYPQFSINSAFPHGSKVVRNLKKGDIVLIDGGCSVEGYRSDVTRTVVFGKPSDKQRQVFDIVLKAQQAAHKAIRPGVTCESIDKTAREVIEKSGFGPGYKYFAHRLGHGIGMNGHEYPYLVKGNQLKLKPGMTFSNEPGIYIYGEFGVRVEDCFLVTQDGARFLGGMLSTSIENPFAT
jgi:Xaa-Pro dipeptidase